MTEGSEVGTTEKLNRKKESLTMTDCSVIFVITDYGKTFPSYVIYKGQYRWSTWTENRPKGTRYNVTKREWFNEQTFHMTGFVQ